MAETKRPNRKALSRAEVHRYSRHLLLPEVGAEGQAVLKASRVLLVGAGGLGAPAALYLAAAGVGRLGIVDFDDVDVTNLQRQVLFGTRDVGRPKAEAARGRLADLNPEIEVVPHACRLTRNNALEIMENYDVVVDGADNFATRYLVNDACVILGKPDVYGSVFRFDGQATVFAAPDGPCYRCLYPTPPPPDRVPNCAEAGVLGVLPGIIGSIQANEAIKCLLGRGRSLAGRLLLFDALEAVFREISIPRSADCPVCGPRSSAPELIDYDLFCRGTGSPAPDVPTITPDELKSRIDKGDPPLILDVRDPHEYEICNLGGRLIPLVALPERIGEIDRTADIVVHCRSGIRSARAVKILREAGFPNVWNLGGGLLAWAKEIDPSLPVY